MQLIKGFVVEGKDANGNSLGIMATESMLTPGQSWEEATQNMGLSNDQYIMGLENGYYREGQDPMSPSIILTNSSLDK